MPYLRLLELRSGTGREFDCAEIRVGRDPGLEYVVTGAGSDIVSACHLRFFYRARHWWLEDTWSRNGTYIDDRRLAPAEPEVVNAGLVVRLGKTGPQLKVEAATSQGLESTHIEEAVEPAVPTTPLIDLVVVDMLSGRTYRASGQRIRIGRGVDCEIRPLGVDDELISRTHAEIYRRDDGAVVARDARSVNGTFINGRFIEGECELKKNDQIALGEEGPVLRVKRLAGGDRGARSGAGGLLKRLGWAVLVILVLSVVAIYLMSRA
ncbi:MAG: FHA domain-containing protein [Gemmatimonadota bacterium]|nr:MAG: FHA domain-containing protein [Gemmatimonadota bacterium]